MNTFVGDSHGAGPGDALDQAPVPWCLLWLPGLRAGMSTNNIFRASNRAFRQWMERCSGVETFLGHIASDAELLSTWTQLDHRDGAQPARRTVVVGGNTCAVIAQAQGPELIACQWVELPTGYEQWTPAVQQRDRSFHELLQNLNVGVVIHQPDTSISYSNAAASDMLGLTVEQMTGKAAMDPAWCFLQDDGQPMSVEQYPVMRVLRSKRSLSAYVVGIQRKRDDVCWVLVSAYPEVDDRQELIRVVVTFSNITAVKAAEETQRALRDHLAQSQRVESIGRLAGGIAHDFNNMLGVILGHVDMALLRSDHAGPIYKHLLQIREAADRSARLTSKLLTLARRQSVTPKIIDLNDAVTQMQDILRGLLGERIELRWRHGPPGCLIWLDPTQLDQVLTNLCVNARDAIAASGSGTITMSVDLVSAGDPAGEVVLRVADNGSGMTTQTIAKIFDPFFTTKPDGQGTGLGLAIVQGIVEQNGGHIHVDSEVGRGSCFSVYFPKRTLGSAEPNSSVNVSTTDPRGQEHILVVEDEEGLLDVIKTHLTSLGYRVTALSGPREALAYVNSTHPPIDLLLTDVVMPGMNGKELSRALMERQAGLRCLFMSAYSAEAMNEDGEIPPSFLLLNKPFSLSDLGLTVRKVLDRR
jgi:two-component system, cell cycle sensor histidine kinase and response regulator CckA